MTEKTILATQDWPDVPARTELALEKLDGVPNIVVQRFEKCTEHHDDDHDRNGGLCFARGYHVQVDPAELVLRLMPVIPEGTRIDEGWQQVPGSVVERVRVGESSYLPAVNVVAWLNAAAAAVAKAKCVDMVHWADLATEVEHLAAAPSVEQIARSIYLHGLHVPEAPTTFPATCTAPDCEWSTSLTDHVDRRDAFHAHVAEVIRALHGTPEEERPTLAPNGRSLTWGANIWVRSDIADSVTDRLVAEGKEARGKVAKLQAAHEAAWAYAGAALSEAAAVAEHASFKAATADAEHHVRSSRENTRAKYAAADTARQALAEPSDGGEGS